MSESARHPERLWVQSMEQLLGGFVRQVVPGPGEFDWAEREYVRADRLERTEGLLREAALMLAEYPPDFDEVVAFLDRTEVRELLEGE